MKISTEQKLREIANLAAFYTKDGLQTPFDEIDVEFLLKNSKYNLFVLHYSPNEDVSVLHKSSGDSFSNAVDDAWKHFQDLMASTPISMHPTDDEVLKWQENRLSIVAERTKNGDIKPLKSLKSVIEDKSKDPLGELC